MIQKPFVRPAIATIALLLIPLIAMQFTDEMDWNLFDFVIMGVLIFVISSAYELVTRKVTSTRNRVIIGAAFLFLFLLVWAELAVGIIGTPFAGN
jgi:hypothetical protein